MKDACSVRVLHQLFLGQRGGKRWGATNIPSLKHWGIDFTQGGETYDPRDTDAMVGTYWYDPIQFHKDILILV